MVVNFAGQPWPYNVNKSEALNLLPVLDSNFKFSVRMAYLDEISSLVSSNIPVCICGWTSKTRSAAESFMTSVYPSVAGTINGCGGGYVGVRNCGSVIESSLWIFAQSKLEGMEGTAFSDLLLKLGLVVYFILENFAPSL